MLTNIFLMKWKSPPRYHPSKPRLGYIWTGFLLLGCSLAQPNCRLCVCVCIYIYIYIYMIIKKEIYDRLWFCYQLVANPCDAWENYWIWDFKSFSLNSPPQRYKFIITQTFSRKTKIMIFYGLGNITSF